jgi:hypothetical protein
VPRGHTICSIDVSKEASHDQQRKRSAEHSKRRKGTPLQSAMSMLNFYINRAGKQLSPGRRRVLERAKPELRKAFGREPWLATCRLQVRHAIGRSCEAPTRVRKEYDASRRCSSGRAA